MEYASLREKIAAESAARRLRYANFEQMLVKACDAGLAAGQAASPNPMTVYEADPISGQPCGKSWYVSEGACGFAWVTIYPGNSSFAKWLVKNGHARAAYRGGVQIWISEHGQSIERKSAHADAMAKVFREAGHKAYAGSRLD